MILTNYQTFRTIEYFNLSVSNIVWVFLTWNFGEIRYKRR